MPVNFQPSNKYVASPDQVERSFQKFRKMLEEDATVDYDMLNKASWQGIPQGIFNNA